MSLRGAAKALGASGNGLEGIAWSPRLKRNFIVVEPSPTVFEFDDKWSLVARRNIKGLKFNSDNKGIEGLTYIDVGATGYLIALCEGNFCDGGKRGREVGNGRVLVMKVTGVAGDLSFKMVNVPSSAKFTDYSGIDMKPAANGLFTVGAPRPLARGMCLHEV